MGAEAGGTTRKTTPRGLLAKTAVALCALACGEATSEPLVLGSRIPGISFSQFSGDGRRPLNLNSDGKDDNPTFTGDMLQIFFTSDRETSEKEDVWCAERDNRVEPFRAPQRVQGVNSEETETSVAISLDGLTLWVGSQRDGAMGGTDDSDIWKSTRPPLEPGQTRSCDEGWGEPENVVELNSGYKDIPRPLGMNEHVMPMGSRRDGAEVYRTYFATRPSPGEPFGPPDPHALEGLAPDGAMVDAFLSADGRFLFFKDTDGDDEDGDLVMAWRRSVDDPFEEALPLDGVNTSADERDPWLNPDGTRFFFSRETEEGGYDVFGAQIVLDQFE